MATVSETLDIATPGAAISGVEGSLPCGLAAGLGSTEAPSSVEPRVGSPIATGPVLGPTCLYPSHWTLADLQAHLGDIPAERIRMFPPPGYATEQELVRLQETKEALCELVDGVLVEKAVGAYESTLAAIILGHLWVYLQTNKLGFMMGESGSVRTIVPQVRMPDACFVSWDHFPNRAHPKTKVIPIAPDFAVEVLSVTNTKKEMERKLDEYFQSNSRLVWYIDPQSRTARSYTARHEFTEISGDQTLEGGAVLPGFKIKLSDLFAEADGQSS
jgi:Uma2 family endonuclease